MKERKYFVVRKNAYILYIISFSKSRSCRHTLRDGGLHTMSTPVAVKKHSLWTLHVPMTPTAKATAGSGQWIRTSSVRSPRRAAGLHIAAAMHMNGIPKRHAKPEKKAVARVTSSHPNNRRVPEMLRI